MRLLDESRGFNFTWRVPTLGGHRPGLQLQSGREQADSAPRVGFAELTPTGDRRYARERRPGRSRAEIPESFARRDCLPRRQGSAIGYG